MDRKNIEDLYPLTPLQKGMLFHSMYAPESGEYVTQSTGLLEGRLNLDAFEQAWQYVVDRHTILRTAFVWEDLADPVQVVFRKVSLKPEYHDWQDLTEAEQAQRLEDLLLADRKRGFDITQVPLMRLSLIQMDEDKYQFIWCYHHVLLDGWSLPILIQEVFGAYDAYSKGREAQFPPSLRYRDYIAWLQNQNEKDAEQFWTQSLRGKSHATSIGRPTDDVQLSSKSVNRKAIQEFRLSEEATQALSRLARQHQLTMNTLLQGALSILLSQCSGENDVIFGAVVSGRPAEIKGVESILGLFINTLPVRTQINGSDTTLSWLRELRAQQVQLQQFEYSPLVDIRKWSDVPPGRPIFECLYVFENYPVSPPGSEESDLKMDVGIRNYRVLEKTNYPLVFASGPGTEMLIKVGYDRQRFDDETITQMGEHLQAILHAFTDLPEQQIASLPTLDAQWPTVLGMDQIQIDELDTIYGQSNLTVNQLIIWLGEKLRPGVAIYNTPVNFFMQTDLSVPHFQQAFQALVDASDAMRLIVTEENGIPTQRVLDVLPYTLDFHDFSHHADPRASYDAWVDEQCRKVLILNECLFDSALVKLGDEKFVWFLNQHHIICDATSIGLVAEQVAVCYARAIEGDSGSIEPLPAFMDYVAAEQAYRNSPEYQEDKAYWRRKLEAEAEPIHFYGKAPYKNNSKMEMFKVQLDMERVQKLNAALSHDDVFTKTNDVTYFNIFATVLAAYLYKVSGTTEISLGVPFHNRHAKEFRNTIGMLMVVNPLRASIESGETFLSLMEKIIADVRETRQHSRCAIGNSVGKKSYDVLFNYYPIQFAKIQGVPMERELAFAGHEHDSINLRVRRRASESTFELIFYLSCDVFGAMFGNENTPIVIDHFQQILDAFLDDHAQPLDDVSLLSVQEREQLLTTFNQSDMQYPDDQTIPNLFQAQVKQRPDKIAAVQNGLSFTYQDLNEQANQLANLINKLQQS